MAPSFAASELADPVSPLPSFVGAVAPGDGCWLDPHDAIETKITARQEALRTKAIRVVSLIPRV
jgi:hypothetical protein